MGAPNAGPGNPVYANFAYEVTTEEQARSNVRELVAKKVDAVKIWVDDRGGRAAQAADCDLACRDRRGATRMASRSPPISSITTMRSRSRKPASTASRIWCATRS